MKSENTKKTFLEDYGLVADVDTGKLKDVNKYQFADDETAIPDMLVIPQELKMKSDLAVIDNATRVDVSRRHAILLTQPWVANTIMATGIQNIIKHLAAIMRNTGKQSASINFNDLLEFHISYKRNEDAEKEGNIIVTITPGIEAKLLIKSDEMTEIE